MDEIKDKVAISVESVIHHTLQEIAEKILRESGVKINCVSIEWYDSIGKPDVMSVSDDKDQLFSSETLRLMKENKRLSAALQVEIDKLRNEK